jgi:hypothetical protein
MTECPVCASIQIVYVVGPRATTCYYCGATWIQDGTAQTGVQPPPIPPRMLHGADGAELPAVELEPR